MPTGVFASEQERKPARILDKEVRDIIWTKASLTKVRRVVLNTKRVAFGSRSEDLINITW
jgi:hypothetical protein